MKRVLVLGATGRSGFAVISHLSGRVEIVAGLRTEVDRSRLPGDARITGTALVDLASIASLQRAMRDMDAVVNAIRLREDIPATALVDLHRLILDAAPGAHPPLIVTVGGGQVHCTCPASGGSGSRRPSPPGHCRGAATWRQDTRVGTGPI